MPPVQFIFHLSVEFFFGLEAALCAQESGSLGLKLLPSEAYFLVIRIGITLGGLVKDDVLIQRAPSAVEAKVDDQVILLSPLDFSYHALDPVGARIWSLLETPLTFGDLITELTANYSIDPETCRTDVTPFVERMIVIGTLIAQ